MPDVLTKEEQQALDQLKKTCAKRGPKSPQTLQSCALLKRQLATEEQLRQAEIESIARDNLNEAKRQALAHVTQRVNALQSEGTLLLGALLRASGEYDQILSARAAKPILLDIIGGLALAALPELRLIGRIFNRVVPRVSKTQGVKLAMAEVIDTLGRTPGTARGKAITKDVFGGTKPITRDKRVTTFLESLDSASKDIVEAINNPLSANANVDAATRERFAAYQAKNRILSQIVQNIQRSLVLANLAERLLHQFIVWYNGDVVSAVKEAFNLAGLESIAYRPEDFDRFADLILYDMLRAYVRGNVVFTARYASWVAPQPGAYPAQIESERDVAGLDSSQRDLIYKRFSSLPLKWQDPTRPPIKSFHDLIRSWGAVVNWVHHMPGGHGRI
jgi:hypothetical protein